MLKNTGERLILEQSWNLMTTMEHLHRYNAVSELIRDKEVLDAACGTGYGSLVLSNSAKKVIGIDLSEDAVEYARSHYHNSNLEYKTMSITDIKLPDHSMDVIVSFETIEHVTAECQKLFLGEVSRVLKKDGLFIVSTPNDQLLRDISFGNYKNEFHLCELNEHEFLDLLHPYFPYIELYYQTVTEASSIVKKGIKEKNGSLYSMADRNTMGRYYIAICSYAPIKNKSINSCLLPCPEAYFDERYFMRQSYIYLDLGEGYTGKDYIECKYVSRDGKKFEVEFSLEEYREKNIRALRFDPCECGAKIRIERVENETGKIELIPTNAQENVDGYDVFMTLDPIYEIKVDNLQNLKKISIEGLIEEIPTWIVLREQEHVLEKERRQKDNLERKLEQAEEQHEHQKQEEIIIKEQVRSLSEQLTYANQVSELKEKNIVFLQKEVDGYQSREQKLEEHITELEELAAGMKEDQIQLKIEKEQFRQQMEISAKRYAEISDSTFWRATRPVRKAADIVKKICKKKISVHENMDPAEPAVEKKLKEIDSQLIWLWDEEDDKDGAPLVSIIVPNYNHAPYLRERLDSIYNQSYSNYEVILLDDCSKDESRSILDEYAEKYADKTIRAYNSENCGKPFRQWDKGIALAKGDLIWIAESDDYCELNFLEEMVSLFKKQSVMLAFARSVFMQDGQKVWSTEEYLADLPQLAWDKPFTMTAHNLVNAGFGIKNVIPNVSSAVFRNVGRFSMEENPLWEQMKLCGDWVFYLNLIRGGCVSYTNLTTNYYRVHQQSTSLNVQKTDNYYIEQCDVSKFIVRNFKVDLAIFEAVLHNLKEHYRAIRHSPDGNAVEKFYNIEEISKEQGKRHPNIGMCLYSMSLGGGETYALHLANELKKQGEAVTLLDFRMGSFNERVKSLLNKNVPCVEINSLDHLYHVLDQLGIEVVHSHHASVDGALSDWITDTPLQCRQVITLHGMYETLSKADFKKLAERVMRNCQKFVYIADKNLVPFKEGGYYEPSKFQKLPNGLPRWPVKPVERKTLGIGEQDFVLCLASRGIAEKGWEEAIQAVTLANQRTERNIHLVILGDGPIREQLEKTAPDFVHFTGLVSNVQDYFAMSDVGILPSRFAGESFPLVIIECFFAGRPVIATDIGEVKNQLMDSEGNLAGVLLTLKGWNINIDEFTEKILGLCDNQEFYEVLKSRVESASEKFDINIIAREYSGIYQSLAEN